MEEQFDRLVVDLADLTLGDLSLAGGKATHLGELQRAGFPVPDGFVLTTRAYLVAARNAEASADDPEAAGRKLRRTEVPEAVAEALLSAYHRIGAGSVAVRSSATAEDLPGVSFAGQQDSFLQIDGDEAVLDAVRRCWASLWNERAVAYRRANSIDERGIAIGVVVQKMVPAAAAGVLFTADPLAGTRGRAVIEAVRGLGDVLVSGEANPDHYTVDTAQGAVVENTRRGEHDVLAQDEVVALAALGRRVEQLFDAPQDIEFALDGRRRIWLVQSRNITTLYPLPAATVHRSGGVGTYLSANVIQGYFEPLTPMGIQFFRLFVTGVSRTLGGHVEDAVAGPWFVAEAGMRLYLDVTDALRNRLGYGILRAMASVAESRSSVVLSGLSRDPRVMVGTDPALSAARRIARAALRMEVVPAVIRSLAAPNSARRRYVQELDAMVPTRPPAPPDAQGCLDAVEHLLVNAPAFIIPRVVGMIPPAMVSLGLATRLLRGRASREELQTVTRGAPHNPTTEMDLALWAASTAITADADSRRVLLESSPSEVAQAYRAGMLPSTLEREVTKFLDAYGFRCIGEIDIGVPRWSEDPTHVLGSIANYVRLGDAALSPDAKFAESAREADAMIRELLGRVRGPRRIAVRFVLSRVRELIGLRETPKYNLIRLAATPARELLKPVGEQLADVGRIPDPEAIYFLTIPEARRALAGEDLNGVVVARRAEFARERTRHHIPRVLLSDGTDAEALLAPLPDSRTLVGSPASPGTTSGQARVIFSPEGARIEPGEILVAPSTNPGWTPLFLTAGGLVMEMGGAMSHGAVVAREYGIPAVVGVAGATDRIRSGATITVDGAAGTVQLDGDAAR